MLSRGVLKLFFFVGYGELYIRAKSIGKSYDDGRNYRYILKPCRVLLCVFRFIYKVFLKIKYNDSVFASGWIMRINIYVGTNPSCPIISKVSFE